jgi:hypothetical protein
MAVMVIFVVEMYQKSTWYLLYPNGYKKGTFSSENTMD